MGKKKLMPAMPAKVVYKKMRVLMRTLAEWQKVEDKSLTNDRARFDFLRLITDYRGIALSLYHLHPEEYKAALEDAKRLFEPEIWNPEQQYFDWSLEDAKAADEKED